MGAIEAASYTPEQWGHDLLELYHTRHFQDLFQLTYEHQFLLAICYWPVLQQSLNHNAGQLWILIYKLYNTIRQWLMINSY